MKPMSLLLLLLWSITAVAADPGPANGFRGLKWGDRPARNMATIGYRGGMETYAVVTREGDDRRVAGVDAFLITYGFRSNRLCRVDVSYEIQDFEQLAIVAVLTREWGKPEPLSLLTGRARSDADESREWLSRDGKTFALFSSSDSWQKEKQKHLWILIIEDRKCSREAAEDPGLYKRR